ncbi:MAG TPA: glycosyltransferase family 4 protein [Acidobacteriaceae bacterium]|nr:glycosyltransferase family 4 protein [Acidobacteriaceae bacterium]
MRAVIAVDRPFHSVMLANSLAGQGVEVAIHTAAPRRFYRGLSDAVRTRMVPSPMKMASYALKRELPGSLTRLDTALFDRVVAATLGRPDMFVGWASEALYSARQAKRRGAAFVLDRACPHRDFQEALVARESGRLGVAYEPQPEWFRQRQLEEYELADAILVPSEYTARTFPEHLQAKLVKAPLLGRCAEPAMIRTEANAEFTVGVLGGSPVRKGYLYLLQAWRRLALPKAKLLIRSGNLREYPALRELLASTSNVELVGYVPNISDFYQRCDVFVLPSVDDGFGMALIEAMMNGRACVATRNTGATELVENGREGLVVDAADEEQLAAAILRLYEDAELRRAMGEAAQARAREIAGSGLYDRAIASLLKRTMHGA